MADRRLRTQTEAFWHDEYEVTDDDLDLVAGQILEAGKPREIGSLVSAIILRRFQKEKESLVRQAARGEVYRPADTYEVGDEVVFSAFDFEVGEVRSVRPGHNPRYGDFDVVEVKMESSGAVREFAASLADDHPLNRPVDELVTGSDPEMSQSDMVRLFEHYVAEKLEPALYESEQMVPFEGKWFLHDLLPEIHVGHLNLAEAMIYEAGHPLAAQDMLRDLDLETTVSEAAQVFALNHAMDDDGRFADVSMVGQPIWYLRALMPAAVFQRPAVLEPAFEAEGGEYVGLTMLDVIDEIGDELDDVQTMVLREVSELHFQLPFPHLYAGTLPLTDQWLRMMSLSTDGVFAITMIDPSQDDEFEVWVVPDARYVAGFDDWYTSVGMVVGGEIVVTPTDEPLTFELHITPTRSSRSEWIRSASVEDGGLMLQMQRTTVPVRADRNMLIDVSDADALAEAMVETNLTDMSVRELTERVFAELSKLSSRGLVHIKGLYSVANMIRRTGAVPIFSELTKHACYDPVGDGFWAYDASLEGSVYKTPDEMRERPLSTRSDSVTDQVIQYLGR